LGDGKITHIFSWKEGLTLKGTKQNTKKTLTVTQEVAENCEVILTVEVAAKREQRILEKSARRIAKAVKIAGFRPNKVPYSIVVNRIGEEAIQEEAIEELTTTVYQEAIKEIDIKPYAAASLEDIEWSPLVMKVKVPVDPIVELVDYQDVRVEVDEVSVTDEEIQAELESLREHYITFKPVDRPAQAGDIVSVTQTEKIGDAEAGEPEDRDIELEEKDAESPNFVAQLLEKSVGDTVVFSHTFGETDETADDEAQTIEYTLTVNAIKAKEDLPFDDDFAAQVGDYDNFDELKAKLTDDLLAKKKQEQDSKLTDAALESVIEKATIQWPSALEKYELDRAVNNQRSQLSRYGLDLETFLKSQQKSMEDFREEQREIVIENIKTTLVLGKIIELEKLIVQDEEILNEVERAIAMSGGSEEAANAFRSPSGMTAVANNLLTEKALRRLLVIAKDEVVAEAQPEASIEEEAEEEADTADIKSTEAEDVEATEE